MDADDIEQAKLGDAIAERDVDAVSRVGQHGGVRDAGGSLPGRVGPGLGQIEAMGDRQAGVIGRLREGDGDLAVVLLAEPSQYCRATPTE